MAKGQRRSLKTKEDDEEEQEQKDNEERLDETREAAEEKEEEGATDTSFKETDADKALEEESGTPGMASKQFQALSDAEANLYAKPLTEGGRPHPVAKAGQKQM